MLLWQQSGGSVYVQASADKCRLKMRLPTLRNELIINAVHIKSVGCRQIARLTKYGCDVVEHQTLSLNASTKRKLNAITKCKLNAITKRYLKTQAPNATSNGRRVSRRENVMFIHPIKAHRQH